MKGVVLTFGLLVGVWEYALEDFERMIIVSDDYAIGLQTARERPPLSAEPTEAELAQAYRTIGAFAVRLRCEGKLIYNEMLYSPNPNEVGGVVVTENEIAGDTIRWWLAEGEPGPTMMAVRVQ